jgi:DNA invertase Pin-like site-specific DNA recombinase
VAEGPKDSAAAGASGRDPSLLDGGPPWCTSTTRVSTTDQDLTNQIAAPKAAGCSLIRSEKRSGTSRVVREELKTILAFLRRGDTLTVTRIDRLARSIGDLQDIVRELRNKGATLKATEQPIDTSTASGKAFLDMLGVFAEFETNLRRERQMEGINAAKGQGRPQGPAALNQAGGDRGPQGRGLGATGDCQVPRNQSGVSL